MNTANERPLTHRWLDVLVALGIFVSSLTVYVLTLTPSLSYKSPDGNELATICYVLGLAHMTGYPLYTWLGKLFTFIPVGDVAYRVNLMSAALGAGGVAMLYGIVLLLTRRRLPAAFAALFFAFSLAFWSQTGIAEVYAPNVFTVALTLLLVLVWARIEERDLRAGKRGWRAILLPSPSSTLAFYAFCLAFGLSLGMHMSSLGFAPALALFVVLVNWRAAVSPAKLVGGTLCFLIGVAQFLWLPFQAASLNDPIMVHHAPSTLQGIYDYTLGAFPQMKFAFPLWALPDRVIVYLYLLEQNVRLLGIVIGIYGMWEMLFRRPKRFLLLFVMYLVHLVFFTQYRVFDLDVFFIPAHLLFVVFIGFGVAQLVDYLMRVLRWLARRATTSGGPCRAERPVVMRLGKGMVNVALVVMLLMPVTLQLVDNWAANDYSQDTAINDFYVNAFQLLPENSVLWGRGGVFGYDMFYFRLVYDVRPDVTIPLLRGMRPSRNVMAGMDPDKVYTTEPAPSGGGGKRTPWSPAPGLLPQNAWYVPVLVGQSGTLFNGRRQGLAIYHASATPPELVVSDAQPQHVVNQAINGVHGTGVTLVGYDLDETLAHPGGRVHLRTYWRLNRPRLVLIATALGETQLEAHELGLGNLGRYAEAVGQPEMNSIIVEDYWLVIPSTVASGEQALRVGVLELRPGPRGEPTADDLVTVGTIHVQE